MKILRFLHKKKNYYGQIKGNTVYFLKDSDLFFAVKNKFRLSAYKRVALEDVTILPPVMPSKIICVGLNYRQHAQELGMLIPKEPIIFLKPQTSVIGHNAKIIYPQAVTRLDYEAELALVIGKCAKNLTVSEVDQYILGYTCLNDVTARDLQKKDIQWTRAKSFDTFCPLGPWIETQLNTKDILISLFLNGKLKQQSSTNDFIFPIKDLVSFISKIMTLNPGDIISTGTPSGVGPMNKGDIVEVDISGIGRLRNSVA